MKSEHRSAVDTGTYSTSHVADHLWLARVSSGSSIASDATAPNLPWCGTHHWSPLRLDWGTHRGLLEQEGDGTWSRSSSRRARNPPFALSPQVVDDRAPLSNSSLSLRSGSKTFEETLQQTSEIRRVRPFVHHHITILNNLIVRSCFRRSSTLWTR